MPSGGVTNCRQYTDVGVTSEMMSARGRCLGGRAAGGERDSRGARVRRAPARARTVRAGSFSSNTTCHAPGTGLVCTRCDWPPTADQRVAVVSSSRRTAAATAIATTLGAEAFAAPGRAAAVSRSVRRHDGRRAAARCQSSAGHGLEGDRRERSVGQNQPFPPRCGSRTSEGEGNLHDVLAKLLSEGRKNILIAPAVFFASPDWMRTLSAERARSGEPDDACSGCRGWVASRCRWTRRRAPRATCR